MKRIRPEVPKTAELPPRAPINWARILASTPAAPARRKVDAFTPGLELHPPHVRPVRAAALAQDEAVTSSTAWAAAVISASYSEGVQFLGYPYLAELAQRPEYRVISQTIAEEMTRKWGKFEAKGDDNEKETEPTEEDPFAEANPQENPLEQQAAGVEEQNVEEEQEEKSSAKGERIEQLEEMFKELRVREHCKTLVEQDGFFGRSHLYLDTGDTDNREELRISIGSGSDEFSRVKISPQKPLQRIKTVEAVWCYPTNYESVDPLKSTWYKPEHWFVMGKELHSSRLLTIVGNEVPDLLKPAYSFGGLSMSQMAQPYVNNWLQTRQSVNDLIQAFVVWGLKTNLSESLTAQGEQLFARLDLFNRLRNNRGIMALDKETEEFFNVSATLSGLEALQAQAQEHMAAVSRIPLVKLLGIQPTGLNASSEGEIRVFYDTIAGRQEWLLTPLVTRLMHFCMLSLWGEIDEDITFAWNPLWALDEKGAADVEEVRARTAQIWIDTGVIDKMEERRRVAKSTDTPYPGLDPNYEPDLAAEEEQGLVPKGSGGGLKAIMGEEGAEGAAAGGPQGPAEPAGGPEAHDLGETLPESETSPLAPPLGRRLRRI